MSGIKGANAGEKCARYVHGETKTRLHKIWESMIARCEYEKHPYYADYGGSGITVCDEWHSYIEFRDWAITHGYNDDLTIDRIKNEKGYDASNCRWVTMREQQNNKRSNHIVYLGEIGHTISEWSEILGISKTTIACPFFVDGRAKMLEQSEPKLIKRKEWTQKETDTLVSMRAEGATYQDIARELDRSIASVSNRFKRLQRA